MIDIRFVPSLPKETRTTYHNRLHNEAHNLLKIMLANYGINMPQAFIKGLHGKPELPNKELQFNLSHCNGLVACTVGNIECGIDAEDIRRPIVDTVTKRICTINELEFLENSKNPALDFFRLWTLKESFVKATGDGLSYPLKNVVFLFENGKLKFCGENYCFHQFFTMNHVISLCTKESGTPYVSEGIF